MRKGLAGILLFTCLLTGCASVQAQVESSAPTVTAASMPSAAPTFTPAPPSTITPAPTFTPSQTSTIAPTSTSAPTSTPIPSAAPLDVPSLKYITLSSAPRLERLVTILPGGEPGLLPSGFAFSPDGKFLALDGGRAVRLWDLRLGQVVRELLPPDSTAVPGALAFSPDSKHVARIYQLNQVVIWSIDTGEVLRVLASQSPNQVFTALAYTPPTARRAMLVAAGLTDQQPGLIFWDAQSGEALPAAQSGATEADGFSISPNGRVAVQAGRDGVVRFWDAATGKRAGEQILYACPDALSALAFSRDSYILALQCDGQNGARIFLYQPDYYHPGDLRLINVLETGLPGPGLMSFNRDSALFVMAAGPSSDQVAFYSILNHQRIALLDGFSADIRQLTLSPDGKILALRLADGTVQLWGSTK